MEIKLRNVSWCQLKSQMPNKLAVAIYVTVKHRSTSPALQIQHMGYPNVTELNIFSALANGKITKGG